MFLTERFERIRSWIHYPFPESYYPVIIEGMQLYHRSISIEDSNHSNPRDRKPKDKASKTLKKFKFFGELSLFLLFSSEKKVLRLFRGQKMYWSKVDPKIAQNTCERDRSRACMFTPMPKWPILCFSKSLDHFCFEDHFGILVHIQTHGLSLTQQF